MAEEREVVEREVVRDGPEPAAGGAGGGAGLVIGVLVALVVVFLAAILIFGGGGGTDGESDGGPTDIDAEIDVNIPDVGNGDEGGEGGAVDEEG